MLWCSFPFGVLFGLRMKAKQDTLTQQLQDASAAIDKAYTDGVVDGFTAQPGPWKAVGVFSLFRVILLKPNQVWKGDGRSLHPSQNQAREWINRAPTIG